MAATSTATQSEMLKRGRLRTVLNPDQRSQKGLLVCEGWDRLARFFTHPFWSNSPINTLHNVHFREER